jgi:hypothetical protein
MDLNSRIIYNDKLKRDIAKKPVPGIFEAF